MTRVCLLGSPEVTLQYELLSRETSRDALSTYDLERPFENALAVRTVSIGAAVSLLNDLQWYIVRFVDEALVREPSVSEEEWLSRPLAEALRNGEIEPGATGEYLKVYGLQRTDAEDGSADADDGGAGANGGGANANGEGTDPTDGGERRAALDPGEPGTDVDAPDRTASDATELDDSDAVEGMPSRLVEPLYVRRTDGDVPSYDLRDVRETLVVRLTEAEFSP